MLPFVQRRLLDHIRFRRTDTENQRHKNSSFGKRPERDNIKYGETLGRSVDIIVKSFEDSLATLPAEFDPALIFKLKTDGSVSEDEWRNSKLTLLSEEPDGVVVLFSPDQLNEFRNRIGLYSEPIGDDRKNPRYSWIASVTEEMALWGKENRIGRKLSNTEINPEIEYFFDIELWVFGETSENQTRFSNLERFILENGGSVTDRYFGDEIILARVKVFGSILNQMLEIGDIREIDLPPEPLFEMPNYYNTQIDDFPNPISPPEKDSPGICVIDSGLVTGHPILKDAVGDARAFPLSLGSEIDQNGHGTMVSGLALYGDVSKCIDSLDFSPKFFIFSARVTNSQNRFDDEHLIVNQMEQAIQYFHETYGCRVFNISLGDPNLVFADGKPSTWASTLDFFAKKYNVVIIVSAGNIPLLSSNSTKAENLLQNYPTYLLDRESRILEPSSAVNVLTVGSICQSDSSFHSGRHPGDLILPVGGVDMPSPFTRSGPGVNKSIKPDIVEYGGNYAWNSTQRHFMTHDPGLEVVSTNWQFQEKLFAIDSGTSFSTPRIAHLAGLILKKYPGISANMVRALIANSAKIPENAKQHFANTEDIKRLFGYGLPNQEKALFSTDNCVLLMAEDVIASDAIHIYEVPIPEIFRTTRGERVITICLAYDPPVRHTRKDYTGISLEFRLLRGSNIEQITGWFSSQRTDDMEQIPARFSCNLQPSLRNRGGGTLQKAEFRVKQNSSFEDYPGENFDLIIQSKMRWASRDLFPDQSYAITVTLEHLGVQIDLYNNLRTQVRIDTRDRARIRT